MAPLEEVEEEDLVITDIPWGRILCGERATTVGHQMNREILRLRPDVVLVDAGLPDLGGYEVLRRLREHAALGGTTIIMLSANALQSDIDRAVAAGFDGYWPRPIDREVFLTGLDAVSRRDKLRR